jgi:hypothetical protein
MPHILGQIVKWPWKGHMLDTRPPMLVSQPPGNFLLLMWSIQFPKLQSLSLRIVSDDCVLCMLLLRSSYLIYVVSSPFQCDTINDDSTVLSESCDELKADRWRDVLSLTCFYLGRTIRIPLKTLHGGF